MEGETEAGAPSQLAPKAGLPRVPEAAGVELVTCLFALLRSVGYFRELDKRQHLPYTNKDCVSITASLYIALVYRWIRYLPEAERARRAEPWAWSRNARLGHQ